MSKLTQINVTLPEDLLHYMDDFVGMNLKFKSRSEAVRVALKKYFNIKETTAKETIKEKQEGQ